MVDASAVRKAVSSAALSKPVVLPAPSSRVMDPLMVFTLADPDGGPEPTKVGTLCVDEALERPVLAVVPGVDGTEDPDVTLAESDDAIDRLSANCGNPAAVLFVSGGCTLTTFTPCPYIPLAGIKSDVEPSLRLRTVRSGWKSEQ